MLGWGSPTMLVLQTNKKVYRYCSYCRARMIAVKETPSLLIAHCPKWAETGRAHELVMIQNPSGKGLSHEVYQYFQDLFRPGMGAKEG